ncbi:hypothetical protein [Photorhabdus stackebrandtii]|uniref:Uncharacterized protein n=1 Tax=Photorhabdus stackebrandtii TaxID=1123042 RepID=A0A7X5QQV3_9GAMM|nr:hypothetical protein [Photorhabdus stackebrandtii]NHB98669.1 hypothetical protein [Photorhabdus stackebrandtii]
MILTNFKLFLNPGQTSEAYKNGNIAIPIRWNNIVITNKGQAVIRVSNFWASPFGEYEFYNSIDVWPGENKLLNAPPNAIYYYKITATNLDATQTTEAEFTWV